MLGHSMTELVDERIKKPCVDLIFSGYFNDLSQSCHLLSPYPL